MVTGIMECTTIATNGEIKIGTTIGMSIQISIKNGKIGITTLTFKMNPIKMEIGMKVGIMETGTIIIIINNNRNITGAVIIITITK